MQERILTLWERMVSQSFRSTINSSAWATSIFGLDWFKVRQTQITAIFNHLCRPSCVMWELRVPVLSVVCVRIGCQEGRQHPGRNRRYWTSYKLKMRIKIMSWMRLFTGEESPTNNLKTFSQTQKEEKSMNCKYFRVQDVVKLNSLKINSFFPF